MAVTVTIKLTIAGIDTGPYDIYAYNLEPLVPEFVDISRTQLLNGYTCQIPDGTTIIRIQSTGGCDNYVDLNVNC